MFTKGSPLRFAPLQFTDIPRMLGMPDEPKRLGAMGAFGDMWNAYLLKMEAERVRDRERQSERERERDATPFDRCYVY